MSATTSLIFSTASVPVGARAAAFSHALESVMPLEVSLADEQGFDVNWRASRVDDLIVSRTHLQYAASVCCARRTSRQIARDDDRYVDLLQIRRGTMEIRYAERSVLVRAGELVLTPSEEPKELIASNNSETNSARIPWWLLASRLSQPQQYFNHPFSVHFGLCGVAADFLDTLSDHGPEIPLLASAPLAAQFADVLALAVAAHELPVPFAESSVRQALFERICRYVDQHLTEPELTPRTIATANGISERYLFKLFQQAGFTVAEHVRRRRLATCRRALEDPRQLRRSIAEIAYVNGFSCASRLSKAFRQEFGMTPRAAREKAREKIRK